MPNSIGRPHTRWQPRRIRTTRVDRLLDDGKLRRFKGRIAESSSESMLRGLFHAGPLSRRSAFGTAVIPNERVGRAVVRKWRLSALLYGILEFRNDALGEGLAEFDAPLIE